MDTENKMEKKNAIHSIENNESTEQVEITSEEIVEAIKMQKESKQQEMMGKQQRYWKTVENGKEILKIL